jgi:hypothetical protein
LTLLHCFPALDCSTLLPFSQHCLHLNSTSTCTFTALFFDNHSNFAFLHFFCTLQHFTALCATFISPFSTLLVTAILLHFYWYCTFTALFFTFTLLLLHFYSTFQKSPFQIYYIPNQPQGVLVDWLGHSIDNRGLGICSWELNIGCLELGIGYQLLGSSGRGPPLSSSGQRWVQQRQLKFNGRGLGIGSWGWASGSSIVIRSAAAAEAVAAAPGF